MDTQVISQSNIAFLKKKIENMKNEIVPFEDKNR
jgi:hypothetical protein